MFFACDQAFINTSAWLHQSSKYINTSICSYGCGQAHSGVPKKISNIKLALRQNRLMMLVFCFWVDIHKNSKLIELFQAVEQFDSWVLVRFLSYYVRYLQNGLIFRLHFCTTVRHHVGFWGSLWVILEGKLIFFSVFWGTTMRTRYFCLFVLSVRAYHRSWIWWQ